MTKLRNLGKRLKSPVPTPKSINDMKLQRLAMLGMSRKAAEAPVILMPDGSRPASTEANAHIYFGIALGLAWALGEENLPPTKWSMPE